MPPEAWKNTLALYRARQSDEGAWGYVGPTSASSGSMTCAGVFGVSLCRYHLGEKSPAEDEAVERGLAWLADHFSVTANPGGGAYHFYYLYSLERVGRTLGTEFIGDHEWYPAGATFLVNAQRKDGSWIEADDPGRPGLATSFALLFLTRGTATLTAERAHGGNGILKTNIAQGPAPRVYLVLDCSGSMLEEVGGKTKFDAARDAVRSILAELPDNTDFALRAYGHRKRSIEPGSDDDTELVIPLGPLDRRLVATRLAALRARGKTPLAKSLHEAASDLGLGAAARGADPATAIILLTDGGEDTMPRQDPVAAAGALGGASLQIVGFDIGRDDWGAQLRAMAAAARGNYWSASDPAGLLRDLRAAVLRTPSGFRVLDASGKVVAQGAFGDSKPLAEGKYVFETAFSDHSFREPLWVNTGSTTAVVFDATKMNNGDAAAPSANAPSAASPSVATSPRELLAPATEPPAGARDVKPSSAGSPAASPGRPKFCTHCGNPINAADKFCTKCGQKIPG